MLCHTDRQQRHVTETEEKKRSVAQFSYVRALNDVFKVIPHGAPRPPLFFEREKRHLWWWPQSCWKQQDLFVRLLATLLCELSHSLPKSSRYSGVFSRVSPESPMTSFFLYHLVCFYCFVVDCFKDSQKLMSAINAIKDDYFNEYLVIAGLLSSLKTFALGLKLQVFVVAFRFLCLRPVNEKAC